MSKKRRIIGAYYDDNNKLRPITAPTGRSGSTSTGVPIRLKKKLQNKVKKLPGTEMEELANIDHVDIAIPSRVPPGPYTRQELREIHATRGEVAVEMDDMLYATPSETQAEWLNQPNRRDIRGIDEFPLEVQENFNKHFPDYVAQLEEYYDTQVLPNTSYQIHRNRTTFNRASKRLHGTGLSPGVLGFAYHKKDGSNEVHMSPESMKVFAKGEITKPDDLKYFDTVFHELGHCIGPSGYASASKNSVGKPMEYFGMGFDEGANEILSQRFVLNNTKMTPRLRRQIAGTKKEGADHVYNHLSTYREHQDLVAKASLIASGGDEKEAVKWIEDLRYAPNEEVAQKRVDQFVKQMMKAKTIAEKRGDSYGAMALPQNERQAHSTLFWNKYGGSSQSNQMERAMKYLEIKDPFHDPPDKYKVPVYEWDHEFVSQGGRMISKKVPGTKRRKGEKVIPWWMIV